MRGVRTIPAAGFYTGVKRNALAEDELIAAIMIPQATGPQQFSKIGTRNAMVIAVASFCICLNTQDRTVGTGIGSAAPTPRRATDAELFLAGALDEAGLGFPGRPPGLAGQRVRREGEGQLWRADTPAGGGVGVDFADFRRRFAAAARIRRTRSSGLRVFFLSFAGTGVFACFFASFASVSRHLRSLRLGPSRCSLAFSRTCPLLRASII